MANKYFPTLTIDYIYPDLSLAYNDFNTYKDHIGIDYPPTTDCLFYDFTFSNTLNLFLFIVDDIVFIINSFGRATIIKDRCIGVFGVDTDTDYILLYSTDHNIKYLYDKDFNEITSFENDKIDYIDGIAQVSKLLH